MSYHNTSAPYWSIYALTLKRILNTYRMDLGHLDDRVGIHREKVRRLIRSLHTPDSLPVLNPDEVAAVVLPFLNAELELQHIPEHSSQGA